ncbi:MAG: osmoprotectant transport system substrate-binding protein [Micromonosporaceae bacterium]
MKYRMRIIAVGIGLASVAAFAVACGGGSTGTPGSSATNGGGGNNAFQAYLSCLRQNGVTIQAPAGRPSGRPGGFPSGVRPSGGPGGGGGFPGGGGGFQKPAGVDDATWQKAQTACASLRPSGGPGGNRDNGATRAYRDCLSNHGVTASAGPLNTADPKVAAAEQACAVLRPSTAPSAGG